jgi:hypothetical protein
MNRVGGLAPPLIHSRYSTDASITVPFTLPLSYLSYYPDFDCRSKV